MSPRGLPVTMVVPTGCALRHWVLLLSCCCPAAGAWDPADSQPAPFCCHFLAPSSCFDCQSRQAATPQFQA